MMSSNRAWDLLRRSATGLFWNEARVTLFYSAEPFFKAPHILITRSPLMMRCTVWINYCMDLKNECRPHRVNLPLEPQIEPRPERQAENRQPLIIKTIYISFHSIISCSWTVGLPNRVSARPAFSVQRCALCWVIWVKFASLLRILKKKEM